MEECKLTTFSCNTSKTTDSRSTFYQGDCLVEMNKIADKSIDAIICDLPYGTTKNKWDVILPFGIIWEHYNRVIKRNGAIILFSQGLFTSKLTISNEAGWRYNLVWDKELASGFLNANKMPLRSHEDICVFYNYPPVYNPQFTIGEKNHSQGKQVGKEQKTMNNYGDVVIQPNANGNLKHPKSIIRSQKPHPSTMLHPTQKPIELMEWLIKTYTNEGETVLDNCMGSGTTGVACKKTGRHFVGIEKDEKYFEIAVSRVSAYCG